MGAHGCFAGGCRAAGWGGWALLEAEANRFADDQPAPSNASLLELSAAGGFCFAQRAHGWFCLGGARVRCCHSNGLWASCGQLTCAHGCFAGGCRAARWGGWALLQAVANQSMNDQLVDSSTLNTSLLEMTAAGGFCFAQRSHGWFCLGGARVRCCNSNGFWASCGQLACAHGCFAGGCRAAGWGGWALLEAEANQSMDDQPVDLTLSNASLLELSASSGFCVAQRAHGWFCLGGARVRCCHSNGFWTNCGQLTCAHGCFAGGCRAAGWGGWALLEAETNESADGSL